MLAPLLLLWPLSLALTWLVAQHVANLPYDRTLGESVNLLAKQLAPRADGTALQLPRDAAQRLYADGSDSVYFQVLGGRGELVSGDAELPPPPAADAIGPDEMRFRDDQVRGESVRVAYRWFAQGPQSPGVLVQVAETLSKRAQLATEIVKAVVLPEFVILPLAVLLVWFALARGLAPLNALQQRIRARASDDLSAIDEREAPEEVAPLVDAINDLLARQHSAMQTQKRFLADAAHQLKTPLAGLRTQAELAQREIDRGERDPAAIKTSLQQMARATQGAARMVNQLLSMARTDARSLAARREPVALDELAKEVVRDFVPRAMDKHIDLGYEGAPAGTPARVLGHATLLRELIVNLVDNALHYTPSGGTVTLRVLGDPFGQVVVLQVEDSGPGIPAHERELVFQPFYRSLGNAVEGSGLGLAIVAEVARQHGATVMLEDAREHASPGGGVGARFTLRLPAAPAGAMA
ncbi:MAG TPA: sensor histidine kinase N-terminal domain-containing protein [Burkholderiaceae bacterium]|nr:sensor histidine kinase N-terminal domain-containing protein [Burkholderiaceae bacterium]